MKNCTSVGTGDMVGKEVVVEINEAKDVKDCGQPIIIVVQDEAQKVGVLPVHQHARRDGMPQNRHGEDRL